MDAGGAGDGQEPADEIRSPVAAYLHRLHDRHAAARDGAVATYIPELADADPDWFGICLVTVDGATYEVGDTRQPFTIQSVSKPFTYALALEEVGADAVRRRIGVEPTGDAFNSITLAPDTGLPLNPMVNAGAIAAAGLVVERHPSDGLAHLLEAFGRFAGRRLELDQDVYRSESLTGHRNRAIAHLLRSSGALEGDPEVALDLYFQQCSVAVDAHDLGVMAATLANGGRNPMTGQRAADRSTVRSVLTVMATCGMYDGSGEWLYTVGLPAKSGVGGGVIAVLPGQLGLAVFSPPLDRHGNSVRGVLVCRDASRELDLHLVRAGHHGASPIRAVSTLAQVGSKRQRTERELVELARLGSRAVVFELQGDLEFAAAEVVTRRLVDADDQPHLAVIDLDRVDDIGGATVPLLVELARRYHERGGALVLSGVAGHRDAIAGLGEATLEAGLAAVRTFDELDLALEWCERELLGEPALSTRRVALADHELLQDLTPAQLAEVEQRLELRHFPAGTVVLPQGEPATELVLIVAGHVSVFLALGDGGTRRLATLTAGMLVGEMALARGGTRVAEVRADTDVDGYVLAADAIARLRHEDPALRAVLLENLVRIVARRADRVRDELAAWAGR